MLLSPSGDSETFDDDNAEINGVFRRHAGGKVLTFSPLNMSYLAAGCSLPRVGHVTGYHCIACRFSSCHPTTTELEHDTGIMHSRRRRRHCRLMWQAIRYPPLSAVQGDTSGWLQPNVDLDLGCSAILPWK